MLLLVAVGIERLSKQPFWVFCPFFPKVSKASPLRYTALSGFASENFAFKVSVVLPSKFACVAIVVVSLLTKKPEKEIEETFDLVKSGKVD